MSYQLYRNTTLGHTLQEALDELMQMQMLSPNLALRVLLQVHISISLPYYLISSYYVCRNSIIFVHPNMLNFFQFDKSINSALSNRVRQKVNFKAEILNTYRFCDNVWTLMLNNVEFRDLPELTRVDRVKIVACDAKAASLPAKADD